MSIDVLSGDPNVFQDSAVTVNWIINGQVLLETNSEVEALI